MPDPAVSANGHINLKQSVVSQPISRTTPLGVSESYTSPAELNSFPGVLIFFKADADCTMYIEFGHYGADGETIEWDTSIPLFIGASSTFFAPYVKGQRWFRIRIVNGTTAMTEMRLHVEYGTYAVATTTLNGAIPHNFPAIATRGFSPDSDVARDRFSGHQIINKFGRRSSITTAQTGSAPVDITNVTSTTYTGQPAIAIAAAETIEMFSSDAGDTSRVFDVYGISNQGYLVSEQMTTDASDGTTPVTSTTLFYRVFTIDGRGPTDCAGTITFRHSTTTSNIFAILPAGQNRSTIAAWTCPIDGSGLIKKVYASLIRGSGNNTGFADMEFRLRRYGEVWQSRRFRAISSDKDWDEAIYGGLSIPALADIKMRTSLVTATLDISAGFDIELETGLST